MACPKCGGLMGEEFNIDLREYVARCLICSYNPNRKIVVPKCKYTNCSRIPVHGTICTEHIAIAERKRHSMMKQLEKARAAKLNREGRTCA